MWIRGDCGSLIWLVAKARGGLWSNRCILPRVMAACRGVIVGLVLVHADGFPTFDSSSTNPRGSEAGGRRRPSFVTRSGSATRPEECQAEPLDKTSQALKVTEAGSIFRTYFFSRRCGCESTLIALVILLLRWR